MEKENLLHIKGVEWTRASSLEDKYFLLISILNFGILSCFLRKRTFLTLFTPIIANVAALAAHQTQMLILYFLQRTGVIVIVHTKQDHAVF